MPAAKETRLRGHIGRGALIAIWLHAQIFVPLLILIFVYAAREEAQRAEEVDVAFRDVSSEELPPDLPAVDDTPPPPRATPETPEPVRHEEKKKPKDKDKKTKAPKLAQKPPEEPKAKPEPEVPVPPLPPMPKEQPPVPKPPERSHEKMVDLDNDKEVEPPPDAKYLAQKNNRVAEETRATDTNLQKSQQGAQSSAAPSEREDQEIGDDKAKIAELENEKSALGRKAPEVTPHANPELSQPEPAPTTPKSLLALRDAPRREHELTPETADPSLPRTADGTIAMPADRSVRGPRTEAQRLAQGKKMKLALSAKDYEYLFGADAAAERRLAQTERSKKVGRFQQRIGRVQSALENFIPEVKPGNQTALNTRAAPFAAYIARMHRSIHKLWGFGMLEEWDEKSGSNPFNNPDLLTALEIRLNPDGTVDKVTIVKTSGYMPYDAAAIDVVYSAGPYPDPPREIRSKNGKIYLTWRFYRDARQCATSGVDPAILDNPPADGDTVSAMSAPARAPSPAVPRSAASAAAASQGLNLGEGPRHLERNPGESQRGLRVSTAGEETPAASETPAPAAAAALPANFPPRADNPAARLLAQAWFEAYGRGDVTAMLGPAVYPFRSSNGNAANKRSELQAMLRGLVDESSGAGRAVNSVQLVTAAGLRGLIGRLTPGLDDGTGSSLFAVASVGSDTLILILTHRADAWKVAGLARR